MPQDRKYLRRIGNRWYARIPVPNRLRGQRLPDGRTLGPYYQRTLGTADLRKAQHRRHDVYREAHKLFDQLLSPEKQEADNYRAWREKLRANDSGPGWIEYGDGTREWDPNLGLDRVLDEVRELPTGHPAHHAAGDHLADLLSVSELLSKYLEANPKANKTTIANYNTVISAWVEVHGDRSLSPKWVTRKLAADWFTNATEGRAVGTASRYASMMATLWDWQYRLSDDAPVNPFQKLVRAVGNGQRKAAGGYVPFTDGELVELLRALQDDLELLPVVRVAMYSGLRLSEILEATRKQVNGIDCFDVIGGKTRHAARLVPVHPKVTDEVIPEGLTAKALSTRFYRMKQQLGLRSGKTFHSLRKNFATKLEQAGCPEGVAVRLLGHRPLSMSYNIYSAGLEVEELVRWVYKVDY